MSICGRDFCGQRRVSAEIQKYSLWSIKVVTNSTPWSHILVNREGKKFKQTKLWHRREQETVWSRTETSGETGGLDHKSSDLRNLKLSFLWGSSMLTPAGILSLWAATPAQWFYKATQLLYKSVASVCAKSLERWGVACLWGYCLFFKWNHTYLVFFLSE